MDRHVVYRQQPNLLLYAIVTDRPKEGSSLSAESINGLDIEK